MTGRLRKWGLAGALLAGLAGMVQAQTAVPVAQPTGKPAAVVNGEEISTAQLEAVLKMMEREPTPLHLSDAQRRQRQIDGLSMLIDALLMHQFLEHHSRVPPTPPAEVDRRVQEMEEGLRKQRRSLAEHCRDTNQSLAQLKASIADMLRWERYAQPLATDEAVGKYFQENRDFVEGTTVRASHIVLRVPSGTGSKGRADARAKLNQLRAEIVAGRLDFAAAASTYSQDPARGRGGDLGYIPRKTWLFDENCSRAAFALAPGQVSEVVDSDYGVHLIKVFERKEGPKFDYAKNKEVVREMFMEDLHEQILAHQRKAAKIAINLP